MSNIWYRAEGETTYGPMTLAELTSEITTAPRPTDVFVWRPGLPQWQRAQDVREVAERLFTPPPMIPKKAPHAALQPPAPLVCVEASGAAPADRMKSTPGNDRKLEGIGGWLILFAIGQVVGPLKFVAGTLQYYQTIDRTLFDKFPTTFIGEGLINFALFMFYFWTAVVA